jgi:hypothetical protein
MKTILSLAFSLVAVTLATAKSPTTLSGDYLEVRSCDVFTGACVANSEMGIGGREAILVWTVKEGDWKGTTVAGLSVIAVVRTEGTLGDVRYQPQKGRAVIIVDAQATAAQQEALKDMAVTLADRLVDRVVETRCAPIQTRIGACEKSGCASVKAGNLVEINTRCFGEKDHLCGNEETFYPPLTGVQSAMPAFTELASYSGSGLNMTWESTGKRSAFIAAFSR